MFNSNMLNYFHTQIIHLFFRQLNNRNGNLKIIKVFPFLNIRVNPSRITLTKKTRTSEQSRGSICFFIEKIANLHLEFKLKTEEIMSAKNYINQNKNRILDELFSLMRIPSVSSHQERKQDINRCAMQWKDLLLKAGVDHAEIMETEGHPVVFAKKTIDSTLPTVLIYGHYDVMPAEPLELWTSPAFEPEIRDGKIFGRGSDDDKGQSFMHLKAFEFLNSTGQLNVNVKFLIEGEEEIGSPNLEAFMQANKDLLECNTILVSDTSMLGAETPSITTGLRGLIYWELEATGANRDLHSGIFGGAVTNPINELSKILGNLVDSKGKVTIPGFYQSVQIISEKEKELISRVPFNQEAYQKNLGVDELHGEAGFNTIERTGIRPTLDICGMWGGYTGEGSKTVLPSKAFAKVSARLVPYQTPQEIDQLFRNYISQLTPTHLKLSIKTLNTANSYVCPIDSLEYKAAEMAYEKVFNIKPIPVRRGGSIGVVPLFESILGVKPILMGFGLESDATHSPNENFPLDLFFKGIETITEFYLNYQK